MTRPTIVTIVEGRGEVEAVPVLLRRMAESANRFDLHIPTPIRCPKGRLLPKENVVNNEELRRVLSLAANKLPDAQRGAVLILLDADDYCPAQVGPRLEQEARALRHDVLTLVVLAKHAYEAWFLADLDSLEVPFDEGLDRRVQDDPEARANPKEFIRQHLAGNRNYAETVDQPKFTFRFNCQAARTRCSSFRRFERATDQLLAHVYSRLDRAQGE